MRRTVSVEGGNLSCEQAGAGPPACAVHQYTAVSASRALVNGLAASFRVYAINPRGLAGSGPVRDERDHTMIGFADDLRHARQALDVPRWVATGTSTDGMVALLQALNDPDGAGGLILIATAASYRFMCDNAHNTPSHPRHADFRAAQELSQDDPAQAGQRLWQLSLADPDQPGLPDAATITGSSSHARMMAFGSRLADFDLEPELPRIRCPALIIGGRLDPVCPPAHSERIAAAIPHAELRVFEHSGHMPFWEQPGLFRRTVFDWAHRHRLAQTLQGHRPE